MPNSIPAPQDVVAWDRAKDIVDKQYGAGLKKSNPDRFYALTTTIFQQVRKGLRKYEGHPTDGDLIRALLQVKRLVESSYPDYEWTKFVRDADDAMWAKALAPMRTGLTPWGVTESYGIQASKSGFKVTEPPTAADTAKVAAVINDPAMPDVADDGKAYVVHWADGRGIFAMRKKADLRPWLTSQGPWAEILSIKHREPTHGGKPLKVMEGRLDELGYVSLTADPGAGIPKTTYDFKFERDRTHAAVLDHLTHVFSGKPHETTDEVPAPTEENPDATETHAYSVHIQNRTHALAIRDDVLQHGATPGGLRTAAEDLRKAGKLGSNKRGMPDVDAYIRDHIAPHINRVIDQHFPA